MSSKSKEMVQNENAFQAVVVADTFGDEFVPISDDIPHCLLPILNKPLIDYTLEFLSLGGIEETFLFCCSHVNTIKMYLNKCIANKDGWTLTMKVNIIVSESCRSFGDCLRDLDAKGLLRGNFILLEPGVISNIQLLPLLKKHSDITQHDKGIAMTLILQESGIGNIGRSPNEDFVIAINSYRRVLFHKKLGKDKVRRITFPLDIFLDNPSVSLLHNLKDTHIAICSSSVLPLFSDNFDFQTKDDFVRGLLMNEEILGSTVYCHITRGSQFGGAVTSWRMYQAFSQELRDKWIYPLIPSVLKNPILKNEVCIGVGTRISENCDIHRSVIGEGVIIGKNAKIEDSFIFSFTKIDDDVIITHSIIGENCVIKRKSEVTAGSILGNGCVIQKDTFIENTLVVANKPDSYREGDQLGKNAYSLRITGEDDEDELITGLTSRLSRLHISDAVYDSEDEHEAFSDSSDDELSHTHSPPPDDTKLFYMEVIDSLTRGFEDNLLCDNLILEINSSRYAYNVTVKEVNFNVVRAILTMSLRQPFGPQYFSQLSRLLSYFSPVLKNYIRNESAMIDSLQAIEDIATSCQDLKEKWVTFVLQYFYEKDYVSEDAILDWFATVDNKNKFHSQVKPFTDWLKEAEEASSDEESD